MLRLRRQCADFFPPIRVQVPKGLSLDDRILAAWSHLDDDAVRRELSRSQSTMTVRAARRRLAELRFGARP